MKQQSRAYYMVHFADGSKDCCHCATLKDAELRQEEIRNAQAEKGHKPDETHIYKHTWVCLVDEKLNRVMSESTTMVFEK